MSLCVRKPTICIGKNKAADQLRDSRKADQRLCFCYMDSTIPLLLKSKISKFKHVSVTAQTGLGQTWSEPQIVGFLMHRLICKLQDVVIILIEEGADVSIKNDEGLLPKQMTRNADIIRLIEGNIIILCLVVSYKTFFG